MRCAAAAIVNRINLAIAFSLVSRAHCTCAIATHLQHIASFGEAASLTGVTYGFCKRNLANEHATTLFICHGHKYRVEGLALQPRIPDCAMLFAATRPKARIRARSHHLSAAKLFLKALRCAITSSPERPSSDAVRGSFMGAVRGLRLLSACTCSRFVIQGWGVSFLFGAEMRARSGAASVTPTSTDSLRCPGKYVYPMNRR